MTTSVIFILWLQICAVKTQNNLPAVFEQLEGTWRRTGISEQYEYWQKGEKDTMVGGAYKMVDGEKKALEKLTIRYHEGHYLYIADVPHNPAPVDFLITIYDEKGFFSENPAHDFPKWIKYQFMSPDILNVLIGDKKDTIEFNFSRVD